MAASGLLPALEELRPYAATPEQCLEVDTARAEALGGLLQRLYSAQAEAARDTGWAPPAAVHALALAPPGKRLGKGQGKGKGKGKRPRPEGETEAEGQGQDAEFMWAQMQLLMEGVLTRAKRRLRKVERRAEERRQRQVNQEDEEEESGHEEDEDESSEDEQTGSDSGGGSSSAGGDADSDEEERGDGRGIDELVDEEGMSKFDREQIEIDRVVQQLEDEALREKSWEMRGEVKGASRPENSLLEVLPDMDRAVRPPPEITMETTMALEDLIRKRIQDENYDDPLPRHLRAEVRAKMRQGTSDDTLPALSQEKSKEGLGEVYEKEYMKRTAGIDEDADKVKKKQAEVRRLFKRLCHKLDALAR